MIHEGGELGYALATAFGAALDNPDLIVACIVGDGEAETGPTAAAWHGTKFLNPATDGAVLPILHLNGWKIANPTIFGTMTDEEVTALFDGYGWAVRIVNYGDDLDRDTAAAFSWAHDEIRRIQGEARSGRMPERPRWPMVVLRTPKGFSGPKEIEGKPIEGSFRSHQVPGKELRTNSKQLAAVERWLRSYRPQELFDREGRLAPELAALAPEGEPAHCHEPARLRRAGAPSARSSRACLTRVEAQRARPHHGQLHGGAGQVPARGHGAQRRRAQLPHRVPG